MPVPYVNQTSLALVRGGASMGSGGVACVCCAACIGAMYTGLLVFDDTQWGARALLMFGGACLLTSTLIAALIREARRPLRVDAPRDAASAPSNPAITYTGNDKVAPHDTHAILMVPPVAPRDNRPPPLYSDVI